LACATKNWCAPCRKDSPARRQGRTTWIAQTTVHAAGFNVTKIKGDTVLLDANHPLVGKELRFVKVTAAMASSKHSLRIACASVSNGHHH
jgi:FKBP-type peptidyl-prolyl cis-trans isomerase 2